MLVNDVLLDREDLPQEAGPFFGGGPGSTLHHRKAPKPLSMSLLKTSGFSTARNSAQCGVSHANWKWVTSPNPDDDRNVSVKNPSVS